MVDGPCATTVRRSISNALQAQERVEAFSRNIRGGLCRDSEVIGRLQSSQDSELEWQVRRCSETSGVAVARDVTSVAHRTNSDMALALTAETRLCKLPHHPSKHVHAVPLHLPIYKAIAQPSNVPPHLQTTLPLDSTNNGRHQDHHLRGQRPVPPEGRHRHHALHRLAQDQVRREGQRL